MFILSVSFTTHVYWFISSSGVDCQNICFHTRNITVGPSRPFQHLLNIQSSLSSCYAFLICCTTIPSDPEHYCTSSIRYNLLFYQLLLHESFHNYSIDPSLKPLWKMSKLYFLLSKTIIQYIRSTDTNYYALKTCFQ